MSEVTSEWDDGVDPPPVAMKELFQLDLWRTYLEKAETRATHLRIFGFFLLHNLQLFQCAHTPRTLRPDHAWKSNSQRQDRADGGGRKLSFLLGNVTFRRQPRARSQIPTAAASSELSG